MAVILANTVGILMYMHLAESLGMSHALSSLVCFVGLVASTVVSVEIFYRVFEQLVGWCIGKAFRFLID